MSQGWGPWVGESGVGYNFHVYGRDEMIPPRQGIYIYSKKDDQNVWVPVYMGCGDLSVCCEDPDLLACIDAKEATHIHMRLCASADERATELADLLERYRNAFSPHGCNVVAGDPAAMPAAADAPSEGTDSLAEA